MVRMKSMLFLVTMYAISDAKLIFDYIKLEKKVCTKIKGYYANLRDAELVCSKDANCLAIYDSQCDEKSFSLCTKKAKFINSKSSCVYEKQGKKI